MSLVSVIMPAFNSAACISIALDSVIRQTYRSIEIIIVDDASHDDTVEVARRKLSAEFSGEWRIIELAENGGPSAARNLGIKAAAGSWVQFLDSDDLLLPGKIERQMDVCDTAEADVASVYSPWQWGYVDNGEIEWIGQMTVPDMKGKPPIMCLAAGCRPLLGAGLTRRSVLERIGGFNEALRFWECEEIYVRIAEQGRLVPVPSDTPFYLWRSHRGQPYVGDNHARYNVGPVATAWIDLVVKAIHGRPLEELRLSSEDQCYLIDDCTFWARQLSGHDRAAFARYMVSLRRFHPGFRPSFPRYATILSRYIPYEMIERLATTARTQLAAMRRTPRALAGAKPEHAAR